MSISQETQLYEPIKAYLTTRGYVVRSEVQHCDIVAVNPANQCIIIELKKTFNLSLIIQAMKRLQYTDEVYIAFEWPAKGKAPRGASWSDIRQLCGMLGLGVLAVQFYRSSKPPTVLHICDPSPYRLRISTKKKKRLLREFHERSGDFNQGGSSKKKIVTAYRERALHCASLLQQHGEMSPKKLKELTGYPFTQALLHRNVYQWFVRTSHGVYGLSTLGEQALQAYEHIWKGRKDTFPKESMS